MTRLISFQRHGKDLYRIGQISPAGARVFLAVVCVLTNHFYFQFCVFAVSPFMTMCVS